MMKKLCNLLPLLLLAALLGCGGGPKRVRVNSPEDLTHAKVGVLMGSTHDDYMTKNYPSADIYRVDGEADLFVALETKKIDAVILDKSIYEINHKEGGKYREVKLLFKESYGFGFNYNNPELREQFNQFIAELRADGTFEQIRSKWFDDYKNARMPDLEKPQSGVPIKAGYTASSEGFGFIRDGRPSGFDVELLERFAVSVGRPIEFHPFVFGGLIAALTTGKVDVIAAGLTITEERSKQVAFSDPYYDSGSLLLVLNETEEKPVTADGKPILTDMTDISTSTVGIMTGTIHDAYVKENYPTAKPKYFDSYPEMMMALDMGAIDVGVMDGIIYLTSLQKKGTYDILGVLFEDPYGVGFNYNNTALRDQYNAFLKEIKANGVYDELINRWVDNFETAEMPDLGPAPRGKPLKLGHTGVSDAFDYMKNGKQAGVEIELIERFGRYVGKPIEYYTLNFGGLIAAVSSGVVDMISSAITITEERSKVITFSEPYFVSESLAIVLKSRHARHQQRAQSGYTSIDDLKEKRIGVLMSSVQDEYVSKTYPQAKMMRIDLMPDLVMALKTGQTDAVVIPHPEAKVVLEENPDLALLEDNIYTVEFGIGFREKGMRDEFNAFLKELRKNGMYDQMNRRWMDSTETAVMPVLPAHSGAKPLIIGTTAQSVPFTFVKDGKNAGFDIELVSRFAASKGRPVEFRTMTFGGLIPALVSGKIDILASSAMMTDERKKQVAFSDPYYEVKSNVLVLAKDMASAGAEGTGTGGEGASKSWFAKVKESFHNNLVVEKRYMMIVNGLWQTLIITVFAILLGTIFGGCICALRMSSNNYFVGFAKGYISLMRGIPILVMLMIFFYIVFASANLSATVVAIFTFALNMGAYSSEMFRTSIEGVDRGQKEAGIAMGFTKLQTFIFIILPQAVRKVIPVYKGEVISLLKSTSIVGYIAVVDLTKASDIIRSRTFDAFFPLIVVAIIYFILAWLLGALLDYVNTKTSSAK